MQPAYHKPFLKRFWWLLVVIIFAGGIFVWKVGMKSSESSDPPLITASFIDASKVEKISKFRSCQGHTVVPQDGSESRRNMKHYLLLLPEFIGKKLDVYAPYDATVNFRTDTSKDLEGEISFETRGSNWSMSILHLVVLDTLKNGQKVKAGDLIGHVADRGIDLVYSSGGDGVKMIDGWESPYGALDSVFNHMSDAVFDKYLSDSLKARQDMIYAKAFRDANPCEYVSEGQDAQLNDFAHPEDWMKIN
jgi:hypothetical protein